MQRCRQRHVYVRRLLIMSRRMVWLGMLTVSMVIWGLLLGLIVWLEW